MTIHSANFYTELENDYFKFKSKKIVKVLSQQPEDKFYRFLDKVLSSPANILTHNDKNRIKRDEFLLELRRHITDEVLNKKIEKLILLSRTAEKLYDLIKSKLDELSLSKKSVATQCSAILQHANNESVELKKEIRTHLENIDSTGELFDISSASFISSGGITFLPDDVITKIVDYVSLSLKMLSYRYNLTQDKYITLPVKVPVSEDDLIDARKILYYSILWSNLESAVCSCLYFDGELKTFTSESLQEELIEAGVKEFYEFDRAVNPFERFDFISNERLYSKLTQNFNDAMVDFGVHKTIANIENLSKLDNGRSITLSEIPTYVALLETLCLNDEAILLAGLNLREWVRCYATLEYLARKLETPIVFSFEIISGYLVAVGITYEKARLFIEYVTFKSDSRDVYDCPLIKLTDGSYYFFSTGYFSPGLTNIILSQFSSLKIDLSHKGYGFENEIHTVLEDLNLNYRYFSFNRDGQDYEYDAVLQLNDKVFIFECKNTNLSGGSVIKAKKKFDLLTDAAKQVKRLKEGLLKFPEVFHDKFKKNISDFEVIPVIVNNLPFSLPGLFDDVYVTDYSALSKILHNDSINAIKITVNEGSLSSTATPSHRLWENDTLQANDLLSQFNEPIQLVSFIDNTMISRHFLPIDSEVAFGVCLATTDLDKMKKEKQQQLTKYLN
nr:hypothetical protein [Pantoea cypripedii]